jgi:PTH1 family peptidyl-tRNA hydrolase
MKLVVGLGNPGPEYERTRHNTGYRVVDKLASKNGWKWSERRSRAILASGTIGLEKVVLAKPITFMNLSGQAVAELARWYKIQPEDLLVVYDELDLPVGKIRLRAKGSAAGHNGLRDIIHHLHTNAFPRLRIGIGHPTSSHTKGKDHVLSMPKADERILLETGEDRAVEAIELAIRQGIAATMNAVNADPEEAARKEAERLQRQKERQEQARLKREAAQMEEDTDILATQDEKSERYTVRPQGEEQPQDEAPPQGEDKPSPLLWTDGLDS